MPNQNGTATYSIGNMRVVVPKGKVALKNPERAFTVHGEFRATDEKGKPTGEPLSFGSKVIDRDDALNPLTVIDVANGLLTLPAGERGRKASIGIDQDAVNALLESLRSPAEAEAATEGTAAE